MHTFFNKQRFGEPQFIAGVLLLVFLAQCAWLVRTDLRSGPLRSAERHVIERGLEQWRGQQTQSAARGTLTPIDPFTDMPQEAGGTDFHVFFRDWNPDHSALYYLVSTAPLLLWPKPLAPDSVAYWGWLARLPGLTFGLCLGASVWYVARRLYGNAGGYMALTLFCFSPGCIRAAAGWFTQQEVGAAWGAFGAIFTGIAVAHTLYAPREVVLWNWRRILLLGGALAMGVGSQFSLVILVALVLAFLLYLAPERKRAGLAIWLAACAIALLLLLASYFFHFGAFWSGMRNAEFFAITVRAFTMRGAYGQLIRQVVVSCPALIVALPAGLLVFARWQRARYFGNIAPLLMSAIFLVLGLGTPHYPGLGFRLIALPFLFLFVAGIAADVLESQHRTVILPAIAGLLTSYALWSVLQLLRVRV